MGLDISGLGSVADAAKSIINKFWPDKMSDAEKAHAQIQLQEMLQARENALIESQKSIMIAEMNQGDAFTKRARPMIVYCGLLFIFLVHVLFPMITFFTQEQLPELSLPTEFWWAWTGVCGVWVIGRSMEKNGATSKTVNAITGSKN
ncbi:MAG: holin family protein [Candidatus Marinimicrobia bacterium]|jgi:hypothetical protein|nr:holin family protein [Candidatus Neomarinimicrobiota bacterium]